MEVEYMGTTVAACEVVWLKHILKDLGVPITDPTRLFYDNMSCIYAEIVKKGLHIETLIANTLVGR